MSKGESAKLPRNFTEAEMMRMMFGEEFLSASNDNFEESNEEAEIFKDIFFKDGIETISQTGFEIISNSRELILDEDSNDINFPDSRNEILEPLEFETLAFNVDDSSVDHDMNVNIISQNGNFDPHVVPQKGNFGTDIISQNGNFPLQNGNSTENHVNNDMISENLYMGPSEVDLYATIGGNLGTSSDNFIESDPLEFDHEIALHTEFDSESTDEEERTEPPVYGNMPVENEEETTEPPNYGNMSLENERNLTSGPSECDFDIDQDTHNHSSGEETKNHQESQKEPKSLSKDLSDQLRSHANRVLLEAGWQIEPRKRSDRTKLAAFYKYPPEDLIFTTFSKAWRTCGEILAIRCEEVKEWSDVSIFWVDLAESMSRIWTGQSLDDKWRVLDPFVALVCEYKKVHVLRNRGLVRVIEGECVVVSEGQRRREKLREERERDYGDNDYHINEGRKSFKGRRVKRKRCDCGDKGCGVNYNYNCHNDKDSGARKFRLNSSVDIDHIDYDNPRLPMGTKLVNNSFKKARKKSKRISEIDAPEINGENSDIKLPKKPRSSETKPKARRFAITELPGIDFPRNQFPVPENRFSENGFSGNHFSESNFQEDNSLNTIESGLTKSVHDSLALSTTSSNPPENQNEIKNIINNTVNGDDAPKGKKRGRKPKNPVPAGAEKTKMGYKRPRDFHIYDDDLLVTAIMKNKDFNSSEKFASCSNSVPNQNPKRKYKMRALRKTPKRKFQLALRNKSGNSKSKKKNPSSSFDSRRLILTRKTVLSWLIATGGVALNEMIQYRNLKNKSNEIVKQGWISQQGIQCTCCDKTMSLSDFKSHAGPSCQRNNGNLFLGSGKSFTLCQLEAWGAEFRLRRGAERVNGSGPEDRNDDTCALCGDGGELLCCDTCPNTYHPACLPNQDELPEGSWYCWHCICQSCGNAVGGKTDISTSCDLKCLQCEDSYHDTCIGGITSDGDGGWFCGISCQEIHQWLRSHVGVSNFFDDGLSWTLLRSSHEEQKVHSTHKIALMAECNTKLAVGLTLMEECFAPMLDPRTGVDMIPHVVYNRASNFARLDYKGFYTLVLEKGDEIVSVASLRIHGNRIAEMPLVATNTDYRRQGMCRRLLDTIERILRSFRVKLLVLSAIPDLVETWVSGFGFKPIIESEKTLLHNITLMLFPGSSILTKNLMESETYHSGCKKDMHEDHNYEALNDNSSSKLDRNENGNAYLDIRTVDPESTEASVDRQSENDVFL